MILFAHHIFNDPSSIYVLTFLGFCFVVLEMLTPGIGFFGLLGSLCLISSFFLMTKVILWSYFYLGLGFFFMTGELFVTSSGIFFIVGLCFIVGGFICNLHYSVIHSDYLSIVGFIVLLVMMCFGFYLGIRKIISLKKKTDQFFLMVGKKVQVIQDFDHFKGQCLLNGVIWNCQASENYLKGEIVVVIQEDRDQNTLIVKKEENIFG